MSKNCAICGMPLDTGVVVHAECLPRWIPVSERLPKLLECVLTVRSFAPFYEGVMSTACFTGTGFVGTGRSIRHVTHWMALPPDEDEEG